MSAVSLSQLWSVLAADWIGADLGEAMGGASTGVAVTDDPLEAFSKAQAIIDFTAPAATVEFAGLAAQARAVHVIGTTGMTEDDIAKLEPAARHAPIIRAGNMSLGVNLLTKLTKMVAQALDEDFDIEVIEAHHHHKVDAPSGTALMLGEAAAEGRGVKLSEVSDSGRDGITGARKRGTLDLAPFGAVILWVNMTFCLPPQVSGLCYAYRDGSANFCAWSRKAALWGQDKAPEAMICSTSLGFK